MAQFCNECAFWEKDVFNNAGNKFGVCHNVEVAMKVMLDGSTHLEEEGTFYTEGYFGCIYCRPGKFTLIDLPEDENL